MSWRQSNLELAQAQLRSVTPKEMSRGNVWCARSAAGRVNESVTVALWRSRPNSHESALGERATPSFGQMSTEKPIT